MGLGKKSRAAIVVVYVVVFWLVLPAALWWTATWIDLQMDWPRRPTWWGMVVLLPGVAALAWGIGELWWTGHGLPVSALPPPRIVRRGPYRTVRHPIYVGFNITVAGAGLVIGSTGLLAVVAPALLPIWMAYAAFEERGLVRRFGHAYLRYRRQVGMLPRFGLYRLAQLLMAARAIPVKRRGVANVPKTGPAILVANHACYLDPLILGTITSRRVRMLATAEAYRGGIMGWAVRRFVNIPVRRYRTDPVACREMLRVLGEGDLIGMFVESERTVLGGYGGAIDRVARIASRIPVPVIPVGIAGAYDCGPRWAGMLRRRPVTLRVGPPLDLSRGDPKVTIDAAIRGLLPDDPQPVELEGLPMERMSRALWRCPTCLDEAGWRPGELSCTTCGARWTATEDGRLADRDGGSRPLAEIGRPVWDAADDAPIVDQATGWIERDMYGRIGPLEPLGAAELTVGPTGVRFGELDIPIDRIRTTSTERADTLQLASSDTMWQLRPATASVFRLQRAVDRWREKSGATSSGARALTSRAQE